MQTLSHDLLLASGIPVVDMKALGSTLRARRKMLGYTQEDVASMLGFSPRLVGDIERGRETVGFGKVLAYATGLGVDLIAAER